MAQADAPTPVALPSTTGQSAPQAPAAGQGAPLLDDETTQAITAVAKEAVDVGAIDAKRLRTELVSAGATTTASVAEAIATLTPQAADVFARMLSTIAMDVTRNSPVDGGEFGEGS
jgi:phosphoribosylanthranilate isomerase